MGPNKQIHKPLQKTKQNLGTGAGSKGKSISPPEHQSIQKLDNSALNNNVQVKFLKNKDKSKVGDSALQVIKDICRAAGESGCTVTSTARTPQDQAKIMYSNIEKHGVAKQKKLYASAGDKVIDVYQKSEKNGKSAEQIRADMEAKIKAIGPSKVSRHCADFSVLCVVDIAPSSIKDKNRFIEAVNEEKRVSKFLQPKDKDPAYHLEIPVNDSTDIMDSFNNSESALAKPEESREFQESPEDKLNENGIGYEAGSEESINPEKNEQLESIISQNRHYSKKLEWENSFEFIIYIFINEGYLEQNMTTPSEHDFVSGVKKFQDDNLIEPDGIFGPKTWRLFKEQFAMHGNEYATLPQIQQQRRAITYGELDLLNRLARLRKVAHSETSGGPSFAVAVDDFRSALTVRMENLNAGDPLPNDVQVIIKALLLWSKDPGNQWGEGIWDSTDLVMTAPDYALIPASQYKCNAYVAEVLNQSLGLVFRVHKSEKTPGRYFPYRASEWGDAELNIPHFPTTTKPQMGNFWSDGSHTGIYLGEYGSKRLYISARDNGNGVFGLKDQVQREHGIQIKYLPEGGVYRRYTPGTTK